MRVTAEQKAITRRRILDVAVKLFRSNGYEATTTRDIAVAAEIATGTLFNYFPTKEAIVGSLVEALWCGRAQSHTCSATGTSSKGRDSRLYKHLSIWPDRSKRPLQLFARLNRYSFFCYKLNYANHCPLQSQERFGGRSRG